MLNQYGVVDEARNRQYLLEKTQHLVGGFGKGPGDPPGTMQCAKLPLFRDIAELSRSPPLILWDGLLGFPG